MSGCRWVRMGGGLAQMKSSDMGHGDHFTHNMWLEVGQSV